MPRSWFEHGGTYGSEQLTVAPKGTIVAPKGTVLFVEALADLFGDSCLRLLEEIVRSGDFANSTFVRKRLVGVFTRKAPLTG